MTGLHINVISKFESGGVKAPKRDTIDTLSHFMSLNGIVFTPAGGVDLVTTPTITLKGKDWYCQLLDDVLKSVNDSPEKVFYVENAVDKLSSPAVIDKLKTLKKLGINMRATIRDGDTDLLDDIENYRYIPADQFYNWIKLTYADKIAIQLNSDECLVIKQNELAQTSRNNLELLWMFLEKPTKSTSRVRI